MRVAVITGMAFCTGTLATSKTMSPSVIGKGTIAPGTAAIRLATASATGMAGNPGDVGQGHIPSGDGGKHIDFGGGQAFMNEANTTTREGHDDDDSDGAREGSVGQGRCSP